MLLASYLPHDDVIHGIHDVAVLLSTNGLPNLVCVGHLCSLPHGQKAQVVI